MQDRNAEMVVNLTQDFTTRDEHAQSGARLSDVMMWLNRDGGGSLMWAFDGQSIACYGHGVASPWIDNNMDFSNYAAVTGRGGPYVTLNGTNEYLSIGDQAWQEAGALSLLVWIWCYPANVSGTDVIAAKWNAGANLRSWLLGRTSSVFDWSTNDTGLGGDTVTVNSTLTVAAEHWYFVAGYFDPSSLMRIYVGREDDAALTIDSLAVGVPASLNDGNVPLTVGCDGAAVLYWDGRSGVGLARANVPSTSINSHVTRLFQSTRWFYGG